jgi:hypothetical protein
VPTHALGDIEHKLSLLRSFCDEVGRDPSTIALSVEAVMALAPDEASLPAVRQRAEKRFGIPAFGLKEGGLVGTPPVIVIAFRSCRNSASARSCCSPMTAGQTKRLNCWSPR